MKKRFLGKLFAALLVAFAAGCASGPSRAADPRSSRIALAEKDDGRHLRLTRGDTLTVELKSNPSTGYRWQTADANSNGVLKAETDKFIAPNTDLCGAPGRQRLSFTAAATGETVLRLVYARPWEKGAPPARSFHVTVSVVEP